jgi:class 3 adenylate cyclase
VNELILAENVQNQKATELANQKRFRNVLIVGFIVVLVFSIVIFIQRNRIKTEMQRSDELLLNILPFEVADDLKKKGKSDARLFENTTVLFTDFEGFTKISETLSPAELVSEINRCFTAFDMIIDKYGLEKIKTIGDAYLAVAGLPNEMENHAECVAKAAIEIRDFVAAQGGRFKIRIGIHSGPVVAGIVGLKKYAYDIWGDTVNTAARMEQSCESGKINISETTFALIHHNHQCTFRGEIEAKGKGEIKMYYLEA